MSDRDRDIDAAVRDALAAEVADVRADDRLLSRIRDAAGPSAHPRRRDVRWAAAAAVLVIVGAVGAASVFDASEEGVIAGLAADDERSAVPLPEAGEVSAEVLADGTPVWVVRHDEETVSALGAVSTHRPFGFGHLVTWCETSRRFVDPAYGSLYDEEGARRAGPAPADLITYATTVDGDAVSIGEAQSSRPPAADPGTSAPSNRSGPDDESVSGQSCRPGTDSANPERVHALGAGRAVPLGEVLEQPIGDVVLVRDVGLLIVEGRPPVLCDGPMRYSLPPRCDGPEVRGLSLPSGQAWATGQGTVIVRVGDGALSELAAVDGMLMETGLVNEEVSTGTSTTLPAAPVAPRPLPDASGSCRDSSESSPATFDEQAGVHAAFVTSFDAAGSPLSFDVVRWLVGDDARQAYQSDNPDDLDEGPHDDYLVNDNDLVRSAPIAPDARVSLVRLTEDGGTNLDPGTVEELPRYIAAGTPDDVYWLTFDAGAIVEVCQQYRP